MSSVNAVGYVNKDLAAGLNLIANPLSNGGNTIGEVIPFRPIRSNRFCMERSWIRFLSNLWSFTGVLSGWQPEVNLPVGDGFLLGLS